MVLAKQQQNQPPIDQLAGEKFTPMYKGQVLLAEQTFLRKRKVNHLKLPTHFKPNKLQDVELTNKIFSITYINS